jgi:hypothetical protein
VRTRGTCGLLQPVPISGLSPGSHLVRSGVRRIRRPSDLEHCQLECIIGQQDLQCPTRTRRELSSIGQRYSGRIRTCAHESEKHQLINIQSLAERGPAGLEPAQGCQLFVRWFRVQNASGADEPPGLKPAPMNTKNGPSLDEFYGVLRKV